MRSWVEEVSVSALNVVDGLIGLSVYPMALAKGAKSVSNLWKKGGRDETMPAVPLPSARQGTGE